MFKSIWHNIEVIQLINEHFPVTINSVLFNNSDCYLTLYINTNKNNFDCLHTKQMYIIHS